MKKRSIPKEIYLFLFVWSIYAVHVVPGGGAYPNRYFDLIHSLVNQGTFAIDSYVDNTFDRAFVNDHYYSAGLPGPSFLGIPAYVTFKVLYRLIPPDFLSPLTSVHSFKQGAMIGFYSRDNTEFFVSTIWITWFLSCLSALGAIVFYYLLVNLSVE